MYLKQNLKGDIPQYAVAAFNAITVITTQTSIEIHVTYE